MRRRTDLLATGIAWALPVALLLLLPVLAGAEDDVPAAGEPGWWVALGTVTAQAAALLGRRRWPVSVALAVAAAVPAAALGGIDAAVGLTSAAPLVATYALATVHRPRRSWPLLVVVGALLATGHALAALGVSAPEAVAGGLLQGVVLVAVAVLVAALVTARRDAVEALGREQDALVQAAVARERTAMARELHDIAAHHLTGIAVLSAAIAPQIDTDPEGAKAAVADVRRQSTAVLRDLRSLVGLLRDPGRADDPARAENLAGIPGLVASAVGQDVALRVLGPDEGAGTGIGPLAQLAAYRMVQESLANAARHAAGAPVEVTVDDRDPAALTITVTNGLGQPSPDAGGRGGLGLVGMQERAELTGSRLEVGSVDDGWRVRLVVPRDLTTMEDA